MPRKTGEELKKVEQERLQGLVLELLREEENKYCADCDAKGPRWASWNLGVFLCIRCAGIHRNLGVHVSKVKSVNLDSWTAEQVQSMRVMGNAKAKAVYESSMPAHFRRPQSDQALEAFIRAKYEHKRYLMKEWSHPRVLISDLPGYGGKENVKVQKTSADHPKISVNAQMSKSPPTAQSAIAPAVSKPSDDLQLVDFSSEPAVQLQSAIPKMTTSQSASLLDIFGPVPSNQQSNELRMPIDQRANGTTSTSAGDLTTLFAGASEPVTESKNDPGKKTNSDILALYGGSTNSLNSSGVVGQFPTSNIGQFAPTQPYPLPAQFGSVQQPAYGQFAGFQQPSTAGKSGGYQVAQKSKTQSSLDGLGNRLDFGGFHSYSSNVAQPNTTTSSNVAQPNTTTSSNAGTFQKQSGSLAEFGQFQTGNQPANNVIADQFAGLDLKQTNTGNLWQ